MGVKETRNQKGSTISLQLQVSVTVLYTLLFRLLDVKCNSWVIHVRMYHFILLVIQSYKGRVEVIDSKRKSLEPWRDMIDTLQRYFQSLWHYIGNFYSFSDIK
jgi:Ca2+/Na+ antiporter